MCEPIANKRIGGVTMKLLMILAAAILAVGVKWQTLNWVQFNGRAGQKLSVGRAVKALT